MAIRRRNSVSKRFTKMKGLPKEERMLLQRVAYLIDAALNNRQPGNPYEPSRNKNNRVVYPVTGLTTVVGIKKTKLVWTASNSDQLLRYSIELTNKDTGATETRSSFTNSYDFYGPAGNYKAVVKSVGRDGSSSPVKELSFEIAGDIMMIEGAKNGPLELGTIIQDDIQHMQGNKIFVWGSVVLDAYQGTIDNGAVILKLWRREGDNATFDLTPNLPDPTTLLETIALYPATESASCLDDAALGSEIKRPAALRLGSFETSMSTMFSPISVATDEVGKRYTYFLQAINREANEDEVGLSLVLWEGAEGQSDAIPGDPNVVAPAYGWPHYNSFHCRNVSKNGSVITDSRYAMGRSFDQYNIIGNQWTMAMWVRFDDLSPLTTGPGSSDPVLNPGTYRLFTRLPMRSDGVLSYNRITLTVQVYQRTYPTEYGSYPPASGFSNYAHKVTVGVYPDDTETAFPDGIANTWTALMKNDENGTSDLFPWPRKIPSDGSTLPQGQDGKNNGWYFIAVSFEGATIDGGGVPKIRLWVNNAKATDSTEPSDAPAGFHTNGMHNQTALILNTIDRVMEMTSVSNLLKRDQQNDREDLLYSFGTVLEPAMVNGQYHGDKGKIIGPDNSLLVASNMQIYQAGFWNVAIDNWDGYTYVGSDGYGTAYAALAYLYNGGWGSDVDWLEDSPKELQPDGSTFQAYIHSENLCHFWQFGQVEQALSTGYPFRDIGNHLYRGDINMTGQITPLSGQGAGIPNSWSFTTTLADIYSPEGTNGTTQFDWAYPGQNL